MKDIELKLLVKMHRLINSMDQKTSALAREEDLTLGQFAVLEALYSTGEQSVGSVRDRILSSAGTIPVIIKNLEKRALIQRREDETDRRLCLLSLTEKGRTVIERVIPKNTEMIRQTYDALSNHEKEVMLQMLETLGGNHHGAKN